MDSFITRIKNAMEVAHLRRLQTEMMTLVLKSYGRLPTKSLNEVSVRERIELLHKLNGVLRMSNAIKDAKAS
jgi:hypothetical protein